MKSPSAREEDQPRPAPLRALPPARPGQRRKGERRAEPVRSEAYAHLSLDGLREYRRALADEEQKVSYWRRILQARLDLVSSGATGQGVEHARLTPLLTTERVGAGRRALAAVVPVDDGVPPLPLLEELWERQVASGDEAGRTGFERDLRSAEQQLSAYRAALHVQIASATGELIARYRQSPELCLTVLPVQRSALRD